MSRVRSTNYVKVHSGHALCGGFMQGQSWSLGARWRWPAGLERDPTEELSPARPPRPRDQFGVRTSAACPH